MVYHYMSDIYNVIISPRTTGDLKKVPLSIAVKLSSWIRDVGDRGLREVKKIPGYHDEPLKGKRLGQRSIRLSIAYRAIYVLNKTGEIEFIEVKEVNKHDY
jgi:proteic killer suppression protein